MRPEKMTLAMPRYEKVLTVAFISLVIPISSLPHLPQDSPSHLCLSHFANKTYFPFPVFIPINSSPMSSKDLRRGQAAGSKPHAIAFAKMVFEGADKNGDGSLTKTEIRKYFKVNPAEKVRTSHPPPLPCRRTCSTTPYPPPPPRPPRWPLQSTWSLVLACWDHTGEPAGFHDPTLSSSFTVLGEHDSTISTDPVFSASPSPFAFRFSPHPADPERVLIQRVSFPTCAPTIPRSRFSQHPT